MEVGVPSEKVLLLELYFGGRVVEQPGGKTATLETPHRKVIGVIPTEILLRYCREKKLTVSCRGGPKQYTLTKSGALQARLLATGRGDNRKPAPQYLPKD